MTAIFNYVWWGGDPEERDSATGLSRRDVHLIKKTWLLLYANPVKNGMELFVKLFRAVPETQDFFATIKGLPEERLVVKNQFKAHVLNFMSHLNLAVTNLNQPEIVVPLMYKLGKSHRNIRREHFDTLTQILLGTLRESLHAGNDVIEAWTRFMTFIYKPLFESIAEE
ncbi:uncharacterized globin-like protein aq_211 isoform X2 [Amyelois transitella]|nr:uncharacterized globin-like protein aq_211 isoform X2 [Amyelois transitella]XP_013199699.1 uncharacterized globin-like protein aq_211 isoform X2 [Amyelois transitella]XP_013199700.1 uncharacterized globin-like protein aq_211 isoform X2 [Amyelois transitella]